MGIEIDISHRRGWNICEYIMRRLFLLSIVIGYLLLYPAVSYAELYKWVDENGQVHFQDYPPDSNTSRGGKIEEVRPGKNFSVVGSAPPENPSTVRYPTSRDNSQVPRKQEHTVDLYVTSWCHYCKLAKNYLRSKGIFFKEYDIEQDLSAAKRKKELDNSGGVPFAVINGVKISGYSEEAYARALNRR